MADLVVEREGEQDRGSVPIKPAEASSWVPITVQCPFAAADFPEYTEMLLHLICCCLPNQPIPDTAPGGSPSVCDGFEQRIHSANFLDFPRGRRDWSSMEGKLGLAVQNHPQLQTEF